MRTSWKGSCLIILLQEGLGLLFDTDQSFSGYRDRFQQFGANQVCSNDKTDRCTLGKRWCHETKPCSDWQKRCSQCNHERGQ